MGSRIKSVEIGGESLDADRRYVLATRGYMARGKDGYRSLLIESEGGQCEEIVSEENGILISMMLRQYFMALKVLDQWKHWGPSLDRHWGRVVHHVSKCHPLYHPRSPAACSGGECPSQAGKRRASWNEWTPAKLRARRSSITPLVEHAEDSGGDEDDETALDANHAAVQAMDRELSIMRRVFRKWSRLAGVHGTCTDCLKEDEFEADWTKAIAPRVEGRIRMLSQEQK